MITENEALEKVLEIEREMPSNKREFKAFFKTDQKVKA